ncbi:Sensor histidine kinase [Pseudonocardia sp. Ae168_Ps1]|nr:Sensor histidine kinase [Pseudonocardia sp. Ae150A_Ps1]OLL79397.1 Sensor histidine kinase [Pseudonocardia sp. Ae168_Ps1]OLL86468.1 Sensor histidine kinase [Pseudonocardia sp. Ae263_Ps1]OLL93483.1 Sensor histidine kinase [Pseudonocardia sp. Ae356_Ps1]
MTVGSGTIPAETADEVFRTVQEALLNVAVHAGAACVRVGVVHGPGTLTVLVEDDGRGFDASAGTRLHVAAAGARLGLRSMAARARRLDGELEIDSSPGSGTRLRLTVPCTTVAPAAPGRVRTGVLVAAARPVVRAGSSACCSSANPGSAWSRRSPTPPTPTGSPAPAGSSARTCSSWTTNCSATTSACSTASRPCPTRRPSSCSPRTARTSGCAPPSPPG